MKITIILLAYLFPFSIFGQSDMTIWYYKEIRKVIKWNSNTLTERTKPLNKSYLFYDNTPVDSTKKIINSLAILKDNNLFALSDNAHDRLYEVYKITKSEFLKQGEIQNAKIILTPWNIFAIKYLEDEEDYEAAIHFFDFNTNSIKKLVDLSDEKYQLGDLIRISEIFEINKHSMLVEICECTGGCGFCNYFYINNNQINKYDFKFSNHTEQLHPITSDNTGNYFYAIISSAKPTHLIFNSQLKLISEALPKVGNHTKFIPNAGYNYLNDQYDSFNLHSILDNKEQVIITYKFTFPLERSMYLAYHDTLITRELLSKMSEYELTILKNLIFAKHNYNFDKEFYQAYFNLFAFYNDEEKRKLRTKNINQLLTEQDKENLKLIKVFLKDLN